MGCGGRCTGSSASADRVGYLLRTSLRSELEGRTGYSLHWREQATPAGRSWWALGRSARLIGGIEFGLWPTANTGDGERGRRTPDGRRGRLLTDVAGSGGDWPTARAEDSESAGAHRGVADTLTSAARDWQTPVADDCVERAKGKVNSRGEAKLSGEVLLERVDGVDLVDGVDGGAWSSPVAGDSKDVAYRRDRGVKGKERAALLGQARGEMFPTPHASANSQEGAPNLQTVVSGLPDRDRLSTSGRRRGLLNSEWVGQLMGYPDGWLRALDGSVLKRSGTRLFLK